MALAEFLSKLQDTMGKKVDYGLVGDGGVVHPSLQVRGGGGQCSLIRSRHCSFIFDSLHCLSELDVLFMQKKCALRNSKTEKSKQMYVPLQG